MKVKYSYYIHKKKITREYTYIPTRYIIAGAITVLEILAILAIMVVLCIKVPLFYTAAMITQAVCIVRIIASDDNPDYKVPWLLFVTVLPVVGFMLYFMFYSRKLKPKFVKRLNELKENSYTKDDAEEFAQLKEKSHTAYRHAKMLCSISESHLFTDTKQEYFPSGASMFEKMAADLKNARHFIFLEFFIIEEGKFWNTILDILKQKVSEGVDVRVVYDDIGCMKTLPGNYAKTLKSHGIQAVPFSRLRGHADNEFNNRNHRKILVIDGRIGYTGGVNLADEYIGETIRFGHWKDTGLRLEGNAVHELTKLFLIDYGINVKSFILPCLPLYPDTDTKADGFIVPFGDGPNPIFTRRVGKSVIQNMLYSAKDYVWMTTPYLIIDNDLCTDIENTAMRGVDVKIIVPHIPDKKIVFGMTKSYYKRLIDAGVEIYEYEPGFIHAKSYLCDDDIAMTGTINLDYRSLVHHFENGVWMYGCSCIPDLKADILDTLDKSVRVTPDMMKTNLLQRFIRSVVRIFAPLL
ncbi:MAG: cardiolipin synthase [Oscillospiraceae bacterium]|nr:cardiolipin synthase [Oscillospiraceae bacterium]